MITFNAFLSPWLIIGLLVPLSGFILWQEWKRGLRFRILRMAAACMMLVSLAAILLRPSKVVEKSTNVLLLTPGFEKTKIDSLIKKHPDLILKRSPGSKAYVGSTLLQSDHDLTSIGNDIRFIAGYGMKDYALDLIEDKKFDFIPSSMPEGIIEISVSKNIISHRRYTIDGIYKNLSAAKWIYLKSPLGKEDSVLIQPTGEIPFSLSFSPRQPGNAQYEMLVGDSTGNQVREYIPLTITESKPLRVLFIQSYPTFETQYLKNFLSRKNHQVVIRSQLSKNNFRYEYANRAPIQINTVTRNVIKEFDVLIIDDDAYRALSSSEKTVINEEVESYGLGLLDLLSSALKNNKRSDSFPFDVTSTKTDTTDIILKSKRFNLPAVPLRVKTDTYVKSLLKNKSGILSGYTYDGAGKIGFQLIKETYRLSLSGDSVEYSELWSPLIEQIARPQITPSSLEITTPFPIFPDEPLDVQIISSNEKPLLMADSIGIPLQEDVLLDGVWHARIWADSPGWHQLNVDDTVLSYYISKNEEWETLRIANQMKETFSAVNISDRMSNEEKVTEEREFSPFLFYLLFILSAGFIWLAPKL